MSTVTKVRVRYCETDAIGHVNNVSYFIYIEQARVEFFKGIGLELSNGKLNTAVVSVSCDYVSQSYFDQELEVITSVAKVGEKSVTLEHQIIDAVSKKLIAKGKSVAIILDKEQNKSIPFNDEWRAKLESHLVLA